MALTLYSSSQFPVRERITVKSRVPPEPERPTGRPLRRILERRIPALPPSFRRQVEHIPERPHHVAVATIHALGIHNADPVVIGGEASAG